MFLNWKNEVIVLASLQGLLVPVSGWKAERKKEDEQLTTTKVGTTSPTRNNPAGDDSSSILLYGGEGQEPKAGAKGRSPRVKGCLCSWDGQCTPPGRVLWLHQIPMRRHGKGDAMALLTNPNSCLYDVGKRKTSVK